MVNNQHIHVSSITHKAKIEVNEKGTEAAAATGTIVIPLMGSTIPRIRANVPFIFFIYDTQSNQILFEGILNEPKEVPILKGMPPIHLSRLNVQNPISERAHKPLNYIGNESFEKTMPAYQPPTFTIEQQRQILRAKQIDANKFF